MAGSFPLIIRPAYTLGGQGGGIAYNKEEFDTIVARGLDLSPVKEVLIEESLLGWKEFEMEVMRDHADNCVLVCSIENFDPMGVHTGDSITVAPTQTLTDREFQLMRDASFAVIREIGVETGGSNIQFAVDPQNGRMIVIEMNPRVSRSSALASKATGFPIAKIAAKLAVGYTLDELKNDITRETPASFEPTIDYCVVKIPRFTFEKFPQADPVLTTSDEKRRRGDGHRADVQGGAAKGAAVAGDRPFRLGGDGKDKYPPAWRRMGPRDDHRQLTVPNAERIFSIRHALLAGFTVEEIQALTGIDPWFLRQIEQIVAMENDPEQPAMLFAIPEADAPRSKPPSRPRCAGGRKPGSPTGSSRILFGIPEACCAPVACKYGVLPTYRLVDTCAAEFEAYTPYYYSTYGDEDETRGGEKRKVMILGGGPNRIGQGIEFDYCCCHAAFALKEEGFETVMVNSNPETVSTDYDTSDKLYFEPLTLEDVLNIYEREKCWGGHRAVRRADAAQPRRRVAGKRRQHHRHAARQHRTGRGPQTLCRAARKTGTAPAAQRHRRQRGRGRAASRNASAIPCWCGRRSCWADGRWRSSTRRTTCAGTCARPWPSARSGPSSWTVFSKTPPRWTWTA